MFFSEQLLSREGPLAHVWLAANLERKLTKHQLLATDISKSSQAIVNSNSDQIEPLALRLTGTLLYGIVRIYSRKAKYLLDDVSEALMRLKSAFRSNSNSIILPPQATLIPSVKQVILQDTVTANDLLWQEPLRLDDSSIGLARPPSHFNTEEQDQDESFDQSIELGRGAMYADVDELAGHQGDDIQLDFDLGDAGNHEDDMSIEIGRDAANTTSTGIEDMSMLPDLTFGGIEDAQDLGDLAALDDNQAPLTPTGDGTEGLVTLPVSNKKRSNKFAESDIVRTSKRRILIDEPIELSSAQIREQLQETLEFDQQTAPPLSLQERLDQITHKSSFFPERVLPTTHTTSIAPEEEIPQQSIIDDNLDLGATSFNQLDFNDGPAGDDAAELDFMSQPIDQQPELENEEFEREEDAISKEAISDKIIEVLQTADTETTKFSHVMETCIPDIQYPKRHATNCFFELLVLASSDKIKLQQHELFSDIDISII